MASTNSDSENRNGAPPPTRSAKVFLRSLPPDTDWDELKTLVTNIGALESFEQSGSPDHPTAVVSMSSPDDATLVISRLNNYTFQDATIRATTYMEKGQRGRRGPGGRGMGGGDFGRPSAADMPLRMVVDARFVGAIIGQGGANIREITRESKARCVVDVNRGIRDQNGGMEKVINVYGQPENCSKAAIRILGVVQKEAAKEAEAGATQQPELKLRAHNQLVGRLIGKGGATIKKIMEETGTTIFVSNDTSVMGGNRGGSAYAELAGVFSLERTITIRGTMEAISAAEDRISGKLRQCWENDMVNAPHMAFGGPHPLIPPGLPQDPVFAMHPAPYGQPGGQFQHPNRGAAPLVESVHVYVPNSMVGALIGTKGVHIRNIMRLTGAQIRIEGGVKSGGSAGSDDEEKEKPSHPSDDRLVIINGNDAQQYKAQFWIYQRVCEQGMTYFEEVRLVTEVAVPTKLVGRIIGKAGQNVRELQRMTGAQVKIPETTDADENGETIVRITANFNASQAVQARIRQLVIQYNLQGGVQPLRPE